MALRKATFGSRWASVTDVVERLSKARANRAAQQRHLASLETKIEQRRAAVEQSLSDIPTTQRTPFVAKAVLGFRNELRRESQDVRLAYVRDAAKHRDEVSPVRSHYRSPVQMLVRHSLGSERRSRLMQQIATSGAEELASLAELAAATKDMELGAALCARVGGLMPDKRPFAPVELADALIGEDFRRIDQALLEIDRLTLECVHDDSTFERGRSSGTRDNLQIALMRRNEEAIGADLYEANEED